MELGAPPELDPISGDYVGLAFGIERHVPGYVDAYVGPAAVKEAALAGDAPEPARLLETARTLAVRVAEAEAPETRVGFLTAQVGAMIATCRRLAGEDLPYAEEVRACFDVEPERTPEAVFDAAIAELDGLLPGNGPVAERMVAWRGRFAISPEAARAVIDAVVPELRARTAAIVELPAGESVEFRFVRDQPWSGYNWYLGAARSRVELNTDLPIHANRLTDLLCHEAYPGHHAEHALKDRLLYRERGWGEHAIQLINTPECVVSEGIATLAEGAIFPDEEERAWFRAERVYPAAGLAGVAEPEREAGIARAQLALRAVAGNAALGLHAEGGSEEEAVAYLQRYGLVSEGEARQRLRFLADPLWRAYVFCYHAGHDLLGAWLDAGPARERAARFRTLLTEQIYPSQVARWVADEAG
ncbi:MAG: hypothetical protein M3Q10_15885 [Chloroflexota bacterium]|nr:hypothetical protein [Chloroflexota bacterium]